MYFAERGRHPLDVSIIRFGRSRDAFFTAFLNRRRVGLTGRMSSMNLT
jgi:hypothetical protein